MPLLLRGALAWMAGTAAGLAGVPAAVPSIIGAMAALAAIARGRGLVNAALTMIALAGLQLGADLARADARCLESAARAKEWTVRVLAPATPGSFVRAELVAPGCVVRLAIAVRSGTAASGSVVHVARAEPSLGDRGLLLRDARLTLVRAPGPLARWRNHVARTLDRRFGSDAPMVRALLIADSRGLDPDLRDRYADAGLVHILSISGLHVAIVGGALLLLFESLRLSRTAAGAAAVAVTFIYVVAIGAPPPAARS
ncbi:MAG: ComEC/Rec2 family competence protein, partial [Gemmatimonadaceae bacterium]